MSSELRRGRTQVGHCGDVIRDRLSLLCAIVFVTAGCLADRSHGALKVMANGGAGGTASGYGGASGGNPGTDARPAVDAPADKPVTDAGSELGTTEPLDAGPLVCGPGTHNCTG